MMTTLLSFAFSVVFVVFLLLFFVIFSFISWRNATASFRKSNPLAIVAFSVAGFIAINFSIKWMVITLDVSHLTMNPGLTADVDAMILLLSGILVCFVLLIFKTGESRNPEKELVKMKAEIAILEQEVSQQVCRDIK